jgi:hypothetical protein
MLQLEQKVIQGALVARADDDPDPLGRFPAIGDSLPGFLLTARTEPAGQSKARSDHDPSARSRQGPSFAVALNWGIGSRMARILDLPESAMVPCRSSVLAIVSF